MTGASHLPIDFLALRKIHIHLPTKDHDWTHLDFRNDKQVRCEACYKDYPSYSI